MEIGAKLGELRFAKNLSQGDLEKRTGLLRCYTSRVENGYTVPTIETLEKYARALEVPIYRFFTNEVSVKVPNFPNPDDTLLWGSRGKERDELQQFAKTLSKMSQRDRKLLLVMAQKMAQQNAKR
jgi:transcriptional regulator with XRE-family HTH domain